MSGNAVASMTTPPSSSTPATGDRAPQPSTAAKRKFDEAVAALGVAVDGRGRHKRAKRGTMDTKNPLDRLMSMAKFFPRGVHPFLDIALALYDGSQARWGTPVTPDPTNTIVVPPSEQVVRKAHINAFEEMLSISPESAEVLRFFFQDDKEWATLVKKFREWASQARQHDTNGLKHKINYLSADPSQPITPSIAESESKSDRGVNHPMLRDAIIPWPLRIQIHAQDNGQLTPDAIEARRLLTYDSKTTDGKPAMTARQFPSCFYAEGLYNAEDPEVGLFRSAYLLRIGRHIWTTPSSAFDGAQVLKQVCHARAHGKYSMTPRMLGYICCQARTLISQSEWKQKDGKYDYQKLFDSVLKLFAKSDDPWAVETLDWYTKGIFGGATADDAANDSGADSESEIDRILARRAARSSSSVPSD
ncbi:hypothetical protein C8R45DRAFT_1047389 [Mycena sanguinolenta]|nr:hypothetical protein C8R45DRAFT_1047389 [Mycena sanguinolenta]